MFSVDYISNCGSSSFFWHTSFSEAEKSSLQFSQLSRMVGKRNNKEFKLNLSEMKVTRIASAKSSNINHIHSTFYSLYCPLSDKKHILGIALIYILLRVKCKDITFISAVQSWSQMCSSEHSGRREDHVKQICTHEQSLIIAISFILVILFLIKTNVHAWFWIKHH